jgi:hypothetical protein
MSEHQITRRVFIGTVAFVVSSPLFARFNVSDNKVIKIEQAGQFFKADELTSLVDIADIMIPLTDTPSASDAKVIEVLDAMMLTWAGEETKNQFKRVLNYIDSLAKETFKTAYLSLSLKQRQVLINEIDKRAFDNKTAMISAPYRKLKDIIFHIYYTSEEANPDYLRFPGTYKGCLSETEYQALVDQRLGR